MSVCRRKTWCCHAILLYWCRLISLCTSLCCWVCSSCPAVSVVVAELVVVSWVCRRKTRCCHHTSMCCRRQSWLWRSLCCWVCSSCPAVSVVVAELVVVSWVCRRKTRCCHHTSVCWHRQSWLWRSLCCWVFWFSSLLVTRAMTSSLHSRLRSLKHTSYITHSLPYLWAGQVVTPAQRWGRISSAQCTTLM